MTATRQSAERLSEYARLLREAQQFNEQLARSQRSYLQVEFRV